MLIDNGPGLRAAIVGIVARLVEGEFETIERITLGRRLSADEMRQAIGAYGRTLTMPPDEALDADIDAIDVGTVDGKRRVCVTVPLWTVEEGRSDLCIEATFDEVIDGVWSTTLDDIGVL